MVRLNNKKDIQLCITQGSRISDDLFIDLLNDASGETLYLDKKKINSVVRSLGKKKLLKTATSEDVDSIQKLITYIKLYSNQHELSLDYKYVNTDRVKKVVYNGLNLSNQGKYAEMYSILDMVDMDKITNDIVCLDYTRLLDLLAFEVGCQTYDEMYNIEYFDSVLKKNGILCPTSFKYIDKIVPKNFEKELSEMYLDTSVNSNYYVNTTGHYYNYYMQDCYTESNSRYISFKKILETQASYTACLLLYHFMIRANSSVLDFKLLELRHGKIYFMLGDNKFNKQTFIEKLSDTIYVSLLDRKFEFKPIITMYNRELNSFV